ncbi:putative mitochondrial protein [Cardamine amara subsp. amara]|uniref:Mitochondrial protein n=1 Tax=Cardamine amara subsp. amara TaxID=228776 RepID=A0ABD1AVW8_CARAN
MNRAEKLSLLNGIRFCESGPAVHHLLFADDSLFMCKADLNQCQVLKGILKVYGDATGQSINLLKSSVTFGAGIDEQKKQSLKQVLGIFAEGGAGTYLGLPECFSGSKIQLLDYIKDRLKDRLSGWFARTLSLGGKEVLIKAMAMAMPVYAMSCFKLTKTTLSNLSSALCDFWWNATDDKQKIHWVSWDRMCLSKEYGGLGFSDLQCLNQALLAKQAWRLIQDPECLFAQVLRSRYYHEDEFTNAAMGNRPSFGWRSILFGRELLHQGISRQIGNGESFFVWFDPWIFDNEWRPPYRKQVSFDMSLRVCDLIDVERRGWNLEMLHDLFVPEDIIRIKSIKPVIGVEDFWSWDHTRSGEYTVKSGNWLANQIDKEEFIQNAGFQPSLNSLKERAWSLFTVPKIKAFIWRVCSDALPVVDMLKIRGYKGDNRCQFCGFEGESSNHVLFTCTIARQIWALSRFPVPFEGFDSLSAHSNLFYLFQTEKKFDIPQDIRRLFPWILWRLWKNRNSFLFDNKSFHPLDTIKKIEEEAEEWSLAQIINQEVVDNQGFEEEELKTYQWTPPPCSWKKCNVGVCWSKKKEVAGCAWVLRDHYGEVLMHSRRLFIGIQKKEDANLCSSLWAIQSMKDHHLNQVIFALDVVDLVGAVNRPKAWSSFAYHRGELLASLSSFQDWKVVLDLKLANRGASLIAQSAGDYTHLQSYVASGSPVWLEELFESESCLASFC